MKIYILFLIFISVEAKNITKKCQFSTFVNCGKNVNKFVQEYTLPIPTNQKEISRQCEIFEEVKNCLYNFGQTCMSAMDRIVGNFAISGTNQQMKDFCSSDNQYQKDYLREITCAKDNFGHVSSCYKDYMASLEYMYHDSSGNKLSIFCCGLNRLRRCILDPFEEKCNKNVTALMEMQLLTFTFTDIIMGMCQPYSMEDCPSLPVKADYKDQYKNYYLIDHIYPYAKE